MRNRLRRALSVASLAVLLAGIARADIAPDPGERRRPPRPAPERISEPSLPPAPAPAPERKSCGAGMALLLFGIGVLGAWRLSKTPAPTPRSAT